MPKLWQKANKKELTPEWMLYLWLERDRGGYRASQSNVSYEPEAKQSLKEIRIVNTLCQVIQKRQEEAIRLAKRSQLMIVIGGHDSANTKRLAEACSPLVETHLVEGASEVNCSWLAGKHHIGIAAGTSTPDEALEEVVAKLKSL